MELVESVGEEKGDKEQPIINVNMVEIVHDMSWKQFSKRPILITTFYFYWDWNDEKNVVEYEYIYIYIYRV